MEIKEGLKRIGRNNEVKLKLGKVELEKIQGKAEKLGLNIINEEEFMRLVNRGK